MSEQSVGVIGVGRLGSDVAFALAEQDLGDLVLFDKDHTRAQYLATDLSDTSFGRAYNRKIHSVDNMRDLADCDVILVAAGAPIDASEAVEKVFAANKSIAEEVAQAFAGSSSVFVVASEPADLMTAYLQQKMDIPTSRVLGIGGIVDAFVARNAIGDVLDVSPEYVRTHVVGPHGSGAQLVWNYTSLNGISVDQIADDSQIKAIEQHAKKELEERKSRLDHSNARFAPAMACVELIRCIVRNDRRVLSVTVVVDEAYGAKGVAMSMPCVIGRFGADRRYTPEIGSAAAEKIKEATSSFKSVLAGGAA